jgi:hypothetical protein
MGGQMLWVGFLYWAGPNQSGRRRTAADGGGRSIGFVIHTPPEILFGTGQFPRPMVNAQLFYGVSGIQNSFDQNFLPSHFSVITIWKYPIFPIVFTT